MEDATPEPSEDPPHHASSLTTEGKQRSSSGDVNNVEMQTTLTGNKDDEPLGTEVDSTPTESAEVNESQEPVKVKITKCNAMSNAMHVELLDIGAEMPPQLIIVSREEWRAKSPKTVENKPHLTTTVMFTYVTYTDPCFTIEKCAKMVRKVQRQHMRRGLPDIPFNFLVGGDGRVYEGRGWHTNPSARANYIKLKGFLIEIAYIGDYRVERPGDAMFDAALELVSYGRSNFWIREKFGLIENYE